MPAIRKTAAATLPSPVAIDQPEANDHGPELPYPTVQTRLYNPDSRATYQFIWSDTPFEDIELTVALLIERGYQVCISPDAPPTDNPAPRAPNDTPQNERRYGARTPLPKQERMQLTFGRHAGETLQDVEESDPSYITWLGRNANDASVRKAADAIIARRPHPPRLPIDDDEDLPF